MSIDPETAQGYHVAKQPFDPMTGLPKVTPEMVGWKFSDGDDQHGAIVMLVRGWADTEPATVVQAIVKGVLEAVAGGKPLVEGSQLPRVILT